MVRVPALRQCAQGSNSRVDTIHVCEIVVGSCPYSKDSSPGSPVFLIPPKPAFSIENSSLDEKPLCGLLFFLIYCLIAS